MPDFDAVYDGHPRRLWALNVDDANEKAKAVYGAYPEQIHTVEREPS